MNTLEVRDPIPPLWLSLWVPLLALAWVIPNHYYPWATFHTDAWVAVMMACGSAAVLLSTCRQVVWHGLPTLFTLLALVPFVQLAAGMLPFSGQAWVATAYVLGLVLALLAGARWEMLTPGRAVDGLFLAIVVAAIVSVGLQLRQWLELDITGDMYQVWFTEFSPGRPSANLGQPNQLATLLLWAIMGCGWAVLRKKAKPASAIFTTSYLLFGLALTQSRIAFIAMAVTVLAVWYWRKLWSSKCVQWCVTGLFLYFVVCTYSLQYLSDLLHLNLQIREMSMGGQSSQLRLKAYSLFLDAVWQRPWFGYGWYQLATAQLSVAANHPSLTAFFTHSHNLFLDLMLWCGVPVGGFVTCCLLHWLWRCARQVANGEDVVLLLFILAVGLHAMVELPLHHAYFLLPTGIVVGALNQRHKNPVILRSSRWLAFALWFFVSALLGVIIRDYLHVDSSFRNFRLEGARIGKLPPGSPPDVLLLDDFREFIRNARADVVRGSDEQELELRRKVTYSFPTPANMFNFAKVLAFRHEYAEATDWVSKMQKVQPVEYFSDMRATWALQALSEPDMAKVIWPPVLDVPAEKMPASAP